VKAPADPLIRGPIDDPRKPLVLYVHGGGWFFTGPNWVRHPSVERWARAHVAVWSTDYRPGARSLADVERAYRTVRRRVGSNRRVCIHGESAGAELALMVAARHRSVDCVVAGSGVVDLASVPATSSLRPMIDRELLPNGGLRRWDPLTNAARISQPVLLIQHRADPIVAAAQSRRLARALSRAALIELPRAASGPASYHGPRTTAEADSRAWRAALRLVIHGRLPRAAGRREGSQRNRRLSRESTFPPSRDSSG
jgi:dipeptidyl aminopeptidase/acylaminoacyl peptidase